MLLICGLKSVNLPTAQGWLRYVVGTNLNFFPLNMSFTCYFPLFFMFLIALEKWISILMQSIHHHPNSNEPILLHSNCIAVDKSINYNLQIYIRFKPSKLLPSVSTCFFVFVFLSFG